MLLSRGGVEIALDGCVEWTPHVSVRGSLRFQSACIGRVAVTTSPSVKKSAGIPITRPRPSAEGQVGQLHADGKDGSELDPSKTAC